MSRIRTTTPSSGAGEHHTWLVPVEVERGKLRVHWEGTDTGEVAVWCDDCGAVVTLPFSGDRASLGTIDEALQHSHTLAVLSLVRLEESLRQHHDQHARDIRATALFRRKAG